MKEVEDIVEKYYIKAINSGETISAGEDYDKARKKMIESKETDFDLFDVIKGADNNVIVRYYTVGIGYNDKEKKLRIEKIHKKYHDEYVFDAQTLNILSDSKLLKLILNIRSMDK